MFMPYGLFIDVEAQRAIGYLCPTGFLLMLKPYGLLDIYVYALRAIQHFVVRYFIDIEALRAIDVRKWIILFIDIEVLIAKI